MGRCRGRQGLHLSKVTPNASLWQSTWWTLLAPDITRRRGLGSKQIYTQKQADFKGDRLTHMLVEEFPSIQTESWVWIKGVKWIQFIKQKVRKFILEKKPVEIGFHIFVFTCKIIAVVQLLSRVWPFVTPWTAARQASLSFTISQKLLKLMSIESVMPSNHLVLCHTFSSCLRSFPASGSFPRSVFFASGAQVLNLQLQHQSFQWIFRTDFL